MGILGDLNRKFNSAASAARTADRVSSDAARLQEKAESYRSGHPGADAKDVAVALAKDRGARNAVRSLARDAKALARKGGKLLDR